VHRRVDAWLETGTGSRYDIQERYPDRLILKRAWVHDCWQVLLITGIAFTSLVLVYAVATGSFQLIVNQAAVFAVGLPFFACAVYFIFEFRVLVDVRVEASVVDLELQATDKEQAEADFDSLIMAIKEDKPGTTQPKG
jgi:uncharacterized membrane protein YciS (DUF1049 family)